MYFQFQNKIAYEKTRLFARDIFILTGKFPEYEKSGVIKQLRLMSVSALQDVTEFYASKSPDDASRSLDRAQKTIAKIASLLDLCSTLGFIYSTEIGKWFIICEDLCKQLEETRKTSKKN